MSRVKTLLIAVILVVGILFPTTPTLASPEAIVSITDAALSTGASGSVVLSISATETVSCIDVDVTYDPAVVEVTAASGSDFDSLVSNIQDNHTHLVAYVTSPTGLTGTIKVADITLTRLGGEGTLTLEVITLKDDDGNSIPFTVDNGWVIGVTDDTPPTVITTSLATGVAITATVTATFSEVIDSDTLVFSVDGISGTTTYTGTTATFTPSANLDYSRTYTASVSASDLAGNPMAAYSWTFTTRAEPEEEEPAPPAPPPTPPAGTTNVTGMVTTAGVFETSVTAISDDELCTLTIPEDTVGLTEELEPLDEITILREDDPPKPPKDADIVLAYDLGPDGATFEPAITLTFSYDPADIPEGKDVLVVAYYDEIAEAWVYLEGEVDTVTKTITVSISHFTTFAVIGRAPPEEEEVPPTPAAFTFSSLVISPSQVAPSEEVTISVLVANTGGESGSYSVVLKINDVKEQEKLVTITAGRSKTVTFSVTKEDAGSYSVWVCGLSDSFRVVSEVIPVKPEPAAFSVSSLAVEPTGVKPGEAVAVSIVVANTGGESGSYTVVLKIDGVKEDEKSVTIAAGESQEVSFSVTREEAGDYTVDVDGLSGSFTVLLLVEPPGVNWALNGGLIGAVVIVAGLLIFLVFRRRAY